jgi:hypothetical protein
MPSSSDALRRWLGMFCLVVASGLLIWGQTVFAPYLKGIAFMLYWAICLLFTVGAIVIALMDIRALRRRTSDERRELIERTLNEIETESRISPPPDPRQPEHREDESR